MLWVGLIVVVAIIAMCLDSDVGKIIIGAAVLALGLLLVSWISGFGIFITLAKVCAVIIVVIIIGLILAAIFG